MKYLWIVLLFTALSEATIYLTVTGSHFRRAKLAVGRLHPTAQTGNRELALQIQEELRNDLEFTNLFDFINPVSFESIDRPSEMYSVRYEEFSAIGAAFALKLGYRVDGDKVTLDALLFDITGRKKIFGTRYQYSTAQYYRLVHALSEDILRELTGEKGLFFSRVLMVCRNPKKRNAAKDVFVVDADGRNLTQLTDDNTITLSPSWAPNGQTIAYTQFEWRRYGKVKKKGQVIKRHSLLNGQRMVVSAREGVNSGATWSQDGRKIAATLSYQGRPEIYLLSPEGVGEPDPVSKTIRWRKLSGEGYQSVSQNMLLDVEPDFSPDGERLVLSSAQSGHPMIYIVDLATRVASQLTFAGIYNASPAWSPKGDKILFATQIKGDGNFDLYLIDTDGNNLVRMTRGDRGGRKRVNSENPSWAPTGRHFAFASDESGYYTIYKMGQDDSNKQRISPPDKECSTPAWGPSEG